MKKLILIISIGLIIRVALIFYFADLQSTNYWEYGEIAKNVLNGNGYSLYYFEDSQLEYHYTNKANPSPSAYMPPGYVFFLMPFLLIKNIVLRNLLIIIVQIIISGFVIYQVFALSRSLFSEKTGLIAAFLAAITPGFIYAVYSFTPTIIFQLLVLILFRYLLNNDKSNLSSALLTAVILAVIIYFRTEFILFAGMFIPYKLFKKHYNYSLILTIALILFLSPWSIRNFYTLKKVIPLTSNFGINLYRGNNDLRIGDWGTDEMINEIRAEKGKNPEIVMNEVYLNHALGFIESNPQKFLENAALKVYYLLFFNPDDARSGNIFYVISTFFYFIFFIYGLFITRSIKKFKYFYMFFVYFLIIIAIFFPMARYQTMMRVLMVPFCSYGVYRFIEYPAIKKILSLRNGK